jgi:hypothetical protein
MWVDSSGSELEPLAWSWNYHNETSGSIKNGRKVFTSWVTISFSSTILHQGISWKHNNNSLFFCLLYIWRLKQYVPPKHWFASEISQGVTIQKHNRHIHSSQNLKTKKTVLYSNKINRPISYHEAIHFHGHSFLKDRKWALASYNIVVMLYQYRQKLFLDCVLYPTHNWS